MGFEPIHGLRRWFDSNFSLAFFLLWQLCSKGFLGVGSFLLYLIGPRLLVRISFHFPIFPRVSILFNSCRYQNKHSFHSVKCPNTRYDYLVEEEELGRRRRKLGPGLKLQSTSQPRQQHVQPYLLERLMVHWCVRRLQILRWQPCLRGRFRLQQQRRLRSGRERHTRSNHHSMGKRGTSRLRTGGRPKQRSLQM